MIMLEDRLHFEDAQERFIVILAVVNAKGDGSVVLGDIAGEGVSNRMRLDEKTH
jgi:hypothetical protein